MGEWCENTIRIKAHSPEGEKRLAEFVSKSNTDGEAFTLNGTYPLPMAPEEAITSFNLGSAMAILQYRAGDDTELKRYLSYPWVKAKGITDLPQLEKYLIEDGSANMQKAAIAQANLIKYGVATEDEWYEKNWGTRFCWDSITHYSNSRIYCATFFTKNAPPDEWLMRVSLDYPELHFSLEWEISVFADGGLDVFRGDLVDYCPVFPNEPGSPSDVSHVMVIIAHGRSARGQLADFTSEVGTTLADAKIIKHRDDYMTLSIHPVLEKPEEMLKSLSEKYKYLDFDISLLESAGYRPFSFAARYKSVIKYPQFVD